MIINHCHDDVTFNEEHLKPLLVNNVTVCK